MLAQAPIHLCVAATLASRAVCFFYILPFIAGFFKKQVEMLNKMGCRI